MSGQPQSPMNFADPRLCMRCGAHLTGDDVGMYRKAVDKEAEYCLCLDCLSEKYRVSRAYFEEKIAFLRKNGCQLFPPENAGKS